MILLYLFWGNETASIFNNFISFSCAKLNNNEDMLVVTGVRK